MGKRLGQLPCEVWDALVGCGWCICADSREGSATECEVYGERAAICAVVPLIDIGNVCSQADEDCHAA